MFKLHFAETQAQIQFFFHYMPGLDKKYNCRQASQVSTERSYGTITGAK